LSNDILAKIVVTVVVMIAFAFWVAIARPHAGHCEQDCPTDFLASRR
jgi:hypothetical protein